MTIEMTQARTGRSMKKRASMTIFFLVRQVVCFCLAWNRAGFGHALTATVAIRSSGRRHLDKLRSRP